MASLLADETLNLPPDEWLDKFPTPTKVSSGFENGSPPFCWLDNSNADRMFHHFAFSSLWLLCCLFCHHLGLELEKEDINWRHAGKLARLRKTRYVFGEKKWLNVASSLLPTCCCFMPHYLLISHSLLTDSNPLLCVFGVFCLRFFLLCLLSSCIFLRLPFRFCFFRHSQWALARSTGRIVRGLLRRAWRWALTQGSSFTDLLTSLQAQTWLRTCRKWSTKSSREFEWTGWRSKSIPPPLFFFLSFSSWKCEESCGLCFDSAERSSLPV